MKELRGRDIGLRYADEAARHPYLRDPVTPEEKIDAVVQQVPEE